MTQLARDLRLGLDQQPMDLASCELAGSEASAAAQLPVLSHQQSTKLRVSLLTGGGDKPYALGMTTALTSHGVLVDFIGSDELTVSELLNNPRVNFLNLRGSQWPKANPIAKVLRVLKYYGKLIRYAAKAEPRLFHILWNNKFQFFDRTLLMLYYKLLGKKIAFTAHNVNAGKRDSNDSWLNRLSLKIQYHLSDHIFVHTNGMKSELSMDFRIPGNKVRVIPFGINNTVPNTDLSSAEAKRRLGLCNTEKALLFFGNIAPYKGLEYLIAAFADIVGEDDGYRLIIAGRKKAPDDYWRKAQQAIAQIKAADRIIQRIEYIPDAETELFFKAADVLLLPYTRLFQSGVLFLGYSFGLPVIAADVGCLKDEIIEGETGFIFEAQNASALANTIRKYFNSELYRNLDLKRRMIRDYANERYSWTKVGEITRQVYSDLLVTAQASEIS
jgi:glycosyltransferase involved in cell wall biosynthesis